MSSPTMAQEYPELNTLNPLLNSIVDKTVDNVARKLIGGFRNKRNSQPNAKAPNLSTTVDDTLNATSSASVLAVANRGVHWKEIISKSFTHGISSISTMKFDGQFTIKNGVPEGLKDVPNSPGVYVVYDSAGEVRYIGDAKDLQKRWHAGHLNENKNAEKNGKEYKMAAEFESGCTVKFLVMDSAETAAAVEANILKNEKPPVNKKEELCTEQGTRSNIEAKKMKDAANEAGGLAFGAGKEALKNVGWDVFETLSTTMIKALKDEVVDLFITQKAQVKIRLKRFFDKIWQVIVNLIKAPLNLLRGLFEFVLNALSQAIGKIYQLAKNIYDLGMAALSLMKGSKTMTREETIYKLSEAIITSGTLVFWDAVEPVIESGMVALFAPLAPLAPYISASLCAMGFGLSSYLLADIVPKAVSLILSTEPAYTAKGREAFQQLIANHETSVSMVAELQKYAGSTVNLMSETREHTSELNNDVIRLTRFSLAEEIKKLGAQ